MNSNRVILIIAIIAAATIIIGFLGIMGYRWWQTQEEIESGSKEICYAYYYDQENPGVHSFGADYHIRQWKAFEGYHSLEPAESIDEFCAKYRND